MGQVKNNDSFLGKAEKLKPVLKHRMLRPVGVVSFERKKADSGADFWNTVGIERLGILSVMLSDEPLAYRGIVIPLLGSYWDPGILYIILCKIHRSKYKIEYTKNTPKRFLFQTCLSFQVNVYFI